ncbi:MAG: hypothetical protein LBU17_01565 [Treponema sp.]|jgi:hypothetical protein|nr:hypothetical protein [Treponema sp.]
MTTYPWDDEIMTEYRRRKAHVLEKYGDWEELHKHMVEERPRLEKEGWVFVNPDEVYKKNFAVKLRRRLLMGCR